MNLAGFKEIKSLPNGYYINADGSQLISIRDNIPKSLKVRTNSWGYKTVGIWVASEKRTKTLFIHKLVAECFCDNSMERKIVNHKDGDKLNNYYTNLEWVTKSEDVLHSSRVLGKNEKYPKTWKRKPIVAMPYNGKNIRYNSLNEASQKMRVLKTSISNCLHGRSKTCGGVRWKFQ